MYSSAVPLAPHLSKRIPSLFLADAEAKSVLHSKAVKGSYPEAKKVCLELCLVKWKISQSTVLREIGVGVGGGITSCKSLT